MLGDFHYWPPGDAALVCGWWSLQEGQSTALAGGVVGWSGHGPPPLGNSLHQLWRSDAGHVGHVAPGCAPSASAGGGTASSAVNRRRPVKGEDRAIIQATTTTGTSQPIPAVLWAAVRPSRSIAYNPAFSRACAVLLVEFWSRSILMTPQSQTPNQPKVLANGLPTRFAV